MEHAEIVDRYIGFWTARMAANSSIPNPDDPALAEFATGEQLGQVRSETKANLDQGLALKAALFKLNFTDQRSTSDHVALVDAVREAGLDVVRAQAILATDEFSAEVRQAEEFWRSNGISAVPSAIFNQRWLIQGGQPPEVFAQVIRDVISGKAKEA